MTDGQRRRDADKPRQELLDELYYLRDISGEREQRARELEQQTRDQQQRLAKLAVALRGVLVSRSWRWTRLLRGFLHPGQSRVIDRELARLVAEPADQGMQCDAAGAHAVAPEHPRPTRRCNTRCLFVDVSELALRQGQTGIQRVVREISRALLASPPKGFAVELVYAASGQPYRYARTFAGGLTGKAASATSDAPVEPQAGDLFLGLDHAMDAVLEHASELAAMRAAGVKLCFVLNDTLPLSRPDWFPPDVSATFGKWFETICRLGDRIACISQATEADAREWMNRLQVLCDQGPTLGWFHLGADGAVRGTDDTSITPEQRKVLECLRSTTSFLMVGTLEPRKGHAQTLEAFNRLWEDGKNLTLVLVGRPGWMTEVVQRRIRHHDEFGRRLFWLMDAGDALLDKLYATCTVLLAPSEGEGFGLPLIEAARHGMPVLCRDLAVFREVAGEHAAYFSGNDALSLAAAVCKWLAACERGEVPDSSGAPWSTWDQSTRELLDVALGAG